MIVTLHTDTLKQSRLNVFWGPWARQADGAPPSPFPFPPSLPYPPLPLEVGPLNPARGSGGALLAPPAGSGAEPQSKSNWVTSGATILMIFLRTN